MSQKRNESCSQIRRFGSLNKKEGSSLIRKGLEIVLGSSKPLLYI